jgi:hypothetical protein
MKTRKVSALPAKSNPTGSACETSRLRVQEGRDKPMALFVRREKKIKWFNAQKSYGFINHVFHSWVAHYG